MSNIQMKEAEEIRKRWGGKPCDHPDQLLKEYEGGMSTGDYVCPICGEAGWGRDWPTKDREKENPDKK